ncbi:MAG TPA: YiiD C-terminal domain-containing protein [Chthoniobacterales bacterium]|jgi:thioesterase domain-containing protein|nr:YiiD C-terminal domain-containing protein [Chthoniobacterales bacterium]
MEAPGSLSKAEKFLHEQIPITRAMGLRVVANDENGFVVEAPVALNSNHLRTAFGGSINAVATLAAYGFLWMELTEAAAHVVVAESSIRFLRPVREIIRAICLRPDAKTLGAFGNQFAEKGKARITLRVHVTEAGETAAEFEGHFVARENQGRALSKPPSG